MAAPATSIIIALLIVGMVDCNFTKPNCSELEGGLYEFEQKCTNKYYECSGGILHEHQCLNDTYFHQPSSTCISNRSEILSCKCNDTSGAYWVGDANTCVLAFTRSLDYDEISWDEAFGKCKASGESWHSQMTGRLVHVTSNDMAIAVRDADMDDGNSERSWIGIRTKPGTASDVRENFRWWLDPDKNKNTMYNVTKWSDQLEAVDKEHLNYDKKDCLMIDHLEWEQDNCDNRREYICEIFYNKCRISDPCIAPSICVPDTYWKVMCACPINETCNGTTTTTKPTTTTSTTTSTTTETTSTTTTPTTPTTTTTATSSTTTSTSVAPTTNTSSSSTSTSTTDTVPASTTARPTTTTSTSTMASETTTTTRSATGTTTETPTTNSTESTTSTNTDIPTMTSTTTTTQKPTTTTSTSATTTTTISKNCLPIDSRKYVKATHYNMSAVNNSYESGTVAQLECRSISCGIQKSRCMNGIWLPKPGALCKPHMKVTEFDIPYKQKNKRAKGTHDLLVDLGKGNMKNFGVCASRCTNTLGCTAYGWSHENQHCELYQTFVKEMILTEAQGYKVAERSDVDDLE